jgi:tryptophan 2,3-dioxygenase
MKPLNLWKVYIDNFSSNHETPELIEAMREFDINANVKWPLSHYKSAVRYLQKDPEAIRATGGSNWQKYLPPKFQRIVFFPDLWTEEEKTEWGKSMTAY